MTRLTRGGAAFAILVVMLASGLLAGVAGLRGVASVSAQPAIEVTAAFREAAATVGDRIHLVVAVLHPDEAVVTVQRPLMPSAEVVSDGVPSVLTQPDGLVLTTATFTYQVFALGPVGSGDVTVRWVQDDGTSGALTAPGASLEVLSVRAAGDDALRPLKPQLSIEGAPPAWLWPAAIASAVLLAVAAVAGAIMAWRRRPRPVEAEAEAGDVPEESARARLGAVRGLSLRDDGEFQQFYGTIAEVVRGYLGERFEFNAAALTTRELERRMTAHGVDRWQARLVGGLLDRCDRAVYARQYPDPASADHDLTVAYEIVELSRPPSTPAEPVAS